jgi:glycerol kinase
MQFCADLCGVDLRVAAMPDCSPLGAVRAGQLGLGVHKDLAALSARTDDEVVYSPLLPAGEIASLVRGWQTALGRILT